MNVKIIEIETKNEVKSKISLVSKNNAKLLSLNDGWRFNFSKHSKAKGYKTFVLTTLKKPDIIEGCIIINTENPYQVYMAYLEIAPHNLGDNKIHDKVAGCLIAFACRQSFIDGKEGYLAFDVLEEKKENEVKLMELYSAKYHAMRFGDSTTMIILPEGSEQLIGEFLN